MFRITHGTGTTAKLWFVNLLHQRSYDGKLEFDHDERKLDIVVSNLDDTEVAYPWVD